MSTSTKGIPGHEEVPSRPSHRAGRGDGDADRRVQHRRASSTNSASSNWPVTLTWWRNGNNDLPNLFQQWGGGEMADQVKANPLMDISDVARDEIASVVGSVARRGRLLVRQGLLHPGRDRPDPGHARQHSVDHGGAGDPRGRSGVVRPAEWDSSAPW